MVTPSYGLQESIRFEPMILDLYEGFINEQQARILAIMFKLGGYTTLNTLPGLLKIKQPTISIRVDELTNIGLLRKNTELMPIPIVLLISPTTLHKKNEDRIRKIRSASEYLKKVSKITDKATSKELIQRALNVLFPKESQIAKILTSSYVYPNELLPYKNSPDKMSEYVNLITKKGKKPLLRYFWPVLPLELCVKSKLSYHEAHYEYYNSLINDLRNYIPEEHVAIIPHHLLRFPSDIRNRIETCLKYYQTIRVIDNNILKLKSGMNGILDIVINSNSFNNGSFSGKRHIIKAITREKISTNKAVDIQYCHLRENLSRDYATRDFVVFGDNGCLVIPSRNNIVAYYNIAPSFTNIISDIFKKYWRPSNA
ncbi:MAG: hypothetical protein ACW97X_12580 [Candidatus Hodarchaeales archaeon]